jgi:hypothetical protein
MLFFSKFNFVLATSPAVGRFSIFAYALLATPLLNIMILASLLATGTALLPFSAALVRRILVVQGHPRRDLEAQPEELNRDTRQELKTHFALTWLRISFLSNPLVIMALCSAIFVSVLIADTELMIRRNSLLRQREEGWTFGQVLALTVMLMPCFEAITAIISALPNRIKLKLPFSDSDQPHEYVSA